VSSSCDPGGLCTPAPRAYFGLDASCTFNTGARVQGVLRSAPVALPPLLPGQSIRVSFCSALQTQNGFAVSDYDKAIPWVSWGTLRAPLEWLPDHAAAARSYDLSAQAGQTVRIEWDFDSANNLQNAFRGWQVDDVRVVAPTVVCRSACGTADFDGDGDSATDADIEAFFACLAGSCCSTCGSADFNADGDSATDADIESFFRVLAGGAC
jgi:hypothetical protein